MDNGFLPVMIRALDGFSISLQDIARDGFPGLIRRARTHLRANAPDICSDEIEPVLQRMVLSRCVSELCMNGEWILYPVGAHPDIQFHVSGKTFTGTAVITPKRIHVEMHTGRESCSRESVLHDLAPVIYTQGLNEGSPANREGEAQAARLFLELCVQLMGAPIPATS